MRRRTSFGPARSAVSSLLLVLALSPALGAQQKTQPEQRKKARPELVSRQGEQEQYKIDVRVDLVQVFTSVTDKNGHFVSGLQKENFSVYEDGIKQEIAAFSQEDVPATIGFAIDTSGSMRNKYATVSKAALSFIRAGKPQDQIFLIGFNEEVELLEDFTNDVDLIADQLENTVVSGGTALYDAIYLGVQKAQTGMHQKKALIVFSDGEDRDSYYKLEELTAKVQESDVQVYCIGFLNPIPEKGLFGRWSKSVPEKARDALKAISEETGARAFFPKDLSEIDRIVSEIAHELRNQYGIGYISSNTARDGAWRRIKIAVDSGAPPGSQVRHRRGYFAPKTP